jgi:hypothetical protein
VKFLTGNTHADTYIMLTGRDVVLNLNVPGGRTSSDMSQIFTDVWRKKAIAFAMGALARLAHESAVFCLDENVTEMILRRI